MIGNTAFVVFQTTKCLRWDNSPKKHLHNPFHNSTKRPTEGHEREHGVAGEGSLGTFFPWEWFPPRLFSPRRLKQMIATYLACLRVLVPQESMMFISIFGGSLISRHLQISKTMTQGSHNLTLWNDKISRGFSLTLELACHPTWGMTPWHCTCQPMVSSDLLHDSDSECTRWNGL